MMIWHDKMRCDVPPEREFQESESFPLDKPRETSIALHFISSSDVQVGDEVEVRVEVEVEAQS